VAPAKRAAQLRIGPHRIVRKHESVLKGHGFSRAADAKNDGFSR